ncbi:hypothetical protein [Shewanella marina]|uniref:hypothetical protein n=1 Tax=Shewanella marina TaxID=487319 RepID=UPI000471657A|nr:hypothetical protein [Shewanella marina]
MQPNKLCYLFLPLFLSACGGSDDNSASPVVEEAPAPQYITASFMKTINKCRDEQPNLAYDIFVHNSDGTVKSEHKPEADGSFSVEWQAGEHISIVHNSDNSGLRVTSYVAVPAGDLGKFVSYNPDAYIVDEQCTCRNVKLDFTDVKATYSNYDITVGGYNRNITDIIYSHEICKTSEQLAEPLFVRLQSLDLEVAFAAVIGSEQLTNDEIMVQPSWFENDVNQAQFLTVTDIGIDGASNSMRTFANTEYGRQYYYLDDEINLYTFDGLYEDSLLQANNLKYINNVMGDSLYFAIQRQKITDVNLVYNFGFTDNSEVLMSEAEQLLTGFEGDANQVDYDFSDDIQKHIVFGTYFYDATNNYGIDVFAPIKGTMPNLRLNGFYEAMLDNMQPDDFYFDKFGYRGLTSYSHYLSERAKFTRLPNFKLPTIFNQYNNDFLYISLNNTNKQAATATSNIKQLNQNRMLNREASILRK